MDQTVTPKRITLEAFVRRYSEANQTPADIMEAAVNKLREDSEGHRLAKAAHEAWVEFESYLESAGFEF